MIPINESLTAKGEGKSKHHKRLPDWEPYDKITIEIMPRLKTSGMSGDEWRTSAKVTLWHKGRPIVEDSLPPPYWLPDAHGGRSVAVDQVQWGHACAKPTWLYLVGVVGLAIRPPTPGRRPTHGIWYGDFERAGRAGPTLLGASKEIRRRTPPAFARWLVDLAHSVTLSTQVKTEEAG